MRRLALLLLLLIACGGGFSCKSAEDIGGLKVQLFDRPETYELKFSGNESFVAGTLQRAAREDLRDFEETGFRRASVDDAAYTIESYYREQGFPFTLVTYELQVPEEGQPKVLFTVTEGPRCLLGDVRFTGNQFFRSKDLKGLIGGPTTSLFGLGSLYYVKSRAQAARGAIEDRYYENGFLDVVVSEPEILFNEERNRADLSYEIDEGVRFLLTEVEFPDLDGEALSVARSRSLAFVGRPYFPRLAYEVQAATGEYYTDRGYPDADVATETRIDDETGAVVISVAVDPGIQVRVAEVVVSGNERTLETFIRKRVAMKAGDLYSRSAEHRSFNELYQSGIFRSVEIELVGTGPERELHVRVKEAKTLSVTGEVGYGAFERARVMARLQEDNLAGTGRSLAIEGKLAVKAEAAKIYLTDPWTFGRENILGISTFYNLRQEPSFDRKELGAGINITRPQTRDWRNVYGYLYRFSDAKDIVVDIPDDVIDEGNNAYISELYWASIFDSRDSPFLPTTGTWVRTRIEYAPEELASQLTYSRLAARIARYHPFSEKGVIAWTARAGVIIPIDHTDAIPLQERFFNGGQNSVRSFREGRLGPKDPSGNPIGGEASTVLSVELRHALVASFTGALFADAGNVTLHHQDFFDFADFRYGFGPGIRWLLPIGPVRLDWGINPNPRQEEADWVLQFSVGVAF